VKRISDLLFPRDLLDSKINPDLVVQDLAESASEVVPGAVFFAVRGTRVDGHQFISEVLARRPSAIVVDRPEAFANHPSTILVKSSREALAWASSRWFEDPTAKLALVGITGTNGKTTTTYLLKQVWDQLGIRSGVVGTVETMIGEKAEPATHTTPGPRTLQAVFRRMVEAGVTHAALEVTSIALDQNRVTGCEFDVGLFTNLTHDHLDYHGDFESYYRAKLRFFTEFSLQTGIFNIDDPWGRRFLQETSTQEKLTFSVDDPSAVFYARDIHYSKDGTRAVLETPWGAVPLETPLIGRHNLANCLGVVACAHAIGLNLPKVAEALARATGAPGRLERVTAPGRPRVFVDYAHSPDALSNVLTSLRELPREGRGRIITVFGCGGDRDRTKRPEMAQIVSKRSEVTVATSDNPRTEDPEVILDEMEPGIDHETTDYHREVDRRAAIYLALRLAGPEDIVLVAGKGHETYQTIGVTQFPFDDRQVVREFFDVKF
jgi:UDP-N-acetylmuramoyl-L-alanyl-D-glutamate--2,6-diaminopimelate ligase